MKNTMTRTVGSGGEKYDVTVGFDGLEPEQIQADAMSFYVWKIQRTIRDADESARTDMLENGIHIHASDVGKPVVSTEKLVAQMSDEQAEKALAELKARLGK